MVNQERVWDDFAALPAEAQQQVADFIAFLRARYEKPRRDRKLAPTDLNAEEFIGMWRDRPEMRDSTRWVRETREREWE